MDTWTGDATDEAHMSTTTAAAAAAPTTTATPPTLSITATIRRRYPYYQRLNRDINDLMAHDFSCPSSSMVVTEGEDGLSLRLNVCVFEGAYKNGHFVFHLDIPEQYPFQMVQVWSKHPVWHPNVELRTGRVFLPLDWSPVLTLNSLALAVQMMLLEPSTAHALNPEASSYCSADPPTFEQQVQRTLRGCHYGGVDFPALSGPECAHCCKSRVLLRNAAASSGNSSSSSCVSSGRSCSTRSSSGGDMGLPGGGGSGGGRGVHTTFGLLGRVWSAGDDLPPAPCGTSAAASASVSAAAAPASAKAASALHSEYDERAHGGRGDDGDDSGGGGSEYGYCGGAHPPRGRKRTHSNLQRSSSSDDESDADVDDDARTQSTDTGHPMLSVSTAPWGGDGGGGRGGGGGGWNKRFKTLDGGYVVAFDDLSIEKDTSLLGKS